MSNIDREKREIGGDKAGRIDSFTGRSFGKLLGTGSKHSISRVSCKNNEANVRNVINNNAKVSYEKELEVAQDL